MHKQIRAFLNREHTGQVAFLAELVKVPADNPPGDRAGHAEVAAALLETLGTEVAALTPLELLGGDKHERHRNPPLEVHRQSNQL